MIEKKFDRIDLRILSLLQQDSSLSQRDLADRVGLSQNACWRRLQAIRASGVIEREVLKLNRDKLGLHVVAIVMIRTHHHSTQWLETFRDHVRSQPEVVDFVRISGDFDYMLKVVTSNMSTYDEFYRGLIAKVELQTVTTYFAMEMIVDQRPLDLTLSDL